MHKWANENGRIGEVAQPRLKIKIQLTSLDHSGYLYITTFIMGWLFLTGHRFTIQQYGVHKALFYGCSDRTIRMLNDAALHLGVHEVAASSLDDIHEMTWLISLELIVALET